MPVPVIAAGAAAARGAVVVTRAGAKAAAKAGKNGAKVVRGANNTRRMVKRVSTRRHTDDNKSSQTTKESQDRTIPSLNPLKIFKGKRANTQVSTRTRAKAVWLSRIFNIQALTWLWGIQCILGFAYYEIFMALYELQEASLLDTPEAVISGFSGGGFYGAIAAGGVTALSALGADAYIQQFLLQNVVYILGFSLVSSLICYLFLLACWIVYKMNGIDSLRRGSLFTFFVVCIGYGLPFFNLFPWGYFWFRSVRRSYRKRRQFFNINLFNT